MEDSGNLQRHRHRHSDTEIVGFDGTTSYSGPLSGPLNNKRGGKKSARFNIPESSDLAAAAAKAGNDDDAYVEITLDVREDSVAVHSVKAAGGGGAEDPELALLARGLEKKTTLGSSLARNASSRFRQVSQELKRLTSFTKRPYPGRIDRTKSAAAHALKGLKFISKTDGGAGWAAVEKRFDDLTASTNGLLPKAKFGECIGKTLSTTPQLSCLTLHTSTLLDFFFKLLTN